jgi:hypothetical protein
MILKEVEALRDSTSYFCAIAQQMRVTEIMDAHEKLKKVETAALEEAIAKLVSDATGWKYSCNISEIEYGELGRAQLKLTLETSDWLNVNVNQS